MSLRSPTLFHPFWGATFAHPHDLPNTSTSNVQKPTLEVGDYAYVHPSRLFYCIDATPGAAVWNEYNSEIIAGFPIHVYVNGDTGSDAPPTTGLTSADPLRTLVAAEKLVPNVVNSPVFIHVAPSATPYVMPEFRRRNLRANVFLIGDGAGTGDGFTVLATGSITSQSQQYRFGFSGAAPAVNAWRGKTIEFTAGPYIGYRRTIVSNTATTVDLAEAIIQTGAAVVGLTTFRVIEPAVTIDVLDVGVGVPQTTFSEGMGSATSQLTATTGDTPSLVVINVAMVRTVGDTVPGYAIRDSRVVYLGVEHRTGGNAMHITLDSSSLHCGTNDQDLLGARAVPEVSLPELRPSVTAAERFAWSGWGFSSTGGIASNLTTSWSGFVSGYTVFTQPIIVRDDAFWVIRGGGFFSSAPNAPALIVFSLAEMYYAPFLGPVQASATSSSAVIDVDANARLAVGPTALQLGAPHTYGPNMNPTLAITGTTTGGAASPVAGLRAWRGGRIELSGSVTGSTDGYALASYLGGQINIIQQANAPGLLQGPFLGSTITGALGIFTMDNHTAADEGQTTLAGIGNFVLTTAGDYLFGTGGSSVARTL